MYESLQRVFISKLFMIEEKKKGGNNLATYTFIKRKLLYYGTNIKGKIKVIKIIVQIIMCGHGS